MKCIRTKDGIYEFLWVSDKTYSLKKKGNIDLKDIVAQADSIEGLVDGYYVDVDNQSFTLSECYDNLEDAKKSYKDWISYSDRKYLEYVVILYAFIKTDKGLIYVAKMNEKGELELL